jgi:hypothetical protein
MNRSIGIRPQRGLSSTSEILLVLGIVIAAIAFLPIAARVIGSQTGSVMSNQQSEIASDVASRIGSITSHGTQRIAVTYRPPVEQYVLTVQEQDTITVQLPNTETQSMTLSDVTIENTQIENAEAICISRDQATVRLTDGVCPHPEPPSS